jgi:hypothetical protein
MPIARADVSSTEVSALPDDLAMPSIKNRLRWSKYGARPMETRPDWNSVPGQGQDGVQSHVTAYFATKSERGQCA